MDNGKLRISGLLRGALWVVLLSFSAHTALAQTEPAKQEQKEEEQAAAEEVSIKISYALQLYGQWRDTGSGPNKTDDTTDIFFRRNRLMLSGQLTDVYGFYSAIQHSGDQRIFFTEVSDTPGKSFDILDTFVTADYTDAFRLRAGLTKDQLVRESIESCLEPLSVDRSLFVYTNLPRLNRDFGVVFWGNLVDALVQYRVAAMKGNDSSDDPKSSLRYTARVHVTLWDPEYSLVYRSTYLGQKKVLTIGAGYQTESDAVYGNVAAQTMIKNYKAFTYDVFFEYPTNVGTFTASAAYLKTDFEEAYKGADPDPRSVDLYGEKNGWYSKAGYLLPRKVGPGSLQVFGRYEKWRFAQLAGIYDQEITWTAFGLNYLLKGQDLRLTLEYASNDYDVEDAATEDFKTVTVMLQFRI